MNPPLSAPARTGRRRPSNEFARFRLAADDAPLPLLLQQRASEAERVHTQRIALRVAVLVACDLAALVFVRTLAHWLINTRPAVAQARGGLHALIPGNVLSPVQICVAVLLGLWVCGNYGEGDNRRDPGRLLAGVTLGLTVNWWHVVWSGLEPLRFVGFAVMIVAVWLLLLVERRLVNAVVRLMCRRFGWGPRVLVVGTAATARAARQLPMFDGRGEMRMIGFLDVADEPDPDALGAIGDYVWVLTERDADTVVISDDVDARTARALIDVADAARRQVLMLPANFNAPGIEPNVVWRRGTALVQITRPGTAGHQRVVKRLFDVVVASVLLLLLLPLLAVVALAITLSSPGPVLFRQERVGRGGRRFHIYKFRSMCADAEAQRTALAESSIYEDPRLFKMPHDPRVTRVGALLRRTSIDELPQLWNVLRGEMSLVGPRPPIPSEVALYAEQHYTRFDVRPGITGPWQVNGRNNITEFEEVIRLETDYIRHWTIWKDLEILLRTLPAVVRMDGAH